ncbi:MAG: TonB family protein [Alphaproteobacteria bacterium]|nr:TonB family protein [Alphaproteobacteria bacterium]
MKPLLPTLLLAGSAALSTAWAQEPTPAEAPPVEEELPPITAGPSLVDFVEAPYPDAAAAARAEGTVRLLIALSVEGAVTRAEVLDEPVAEDGSSWGFGEAAAAAALQWRFTPARDTTGPIPVELEFAYDFVAPEPQPEAPPPPFTGPVQITGRLREMGTRRDLDGFPVIATDASGTTVQVQTDASGRFALGGLAAGPVTLSATFPGFSRIDKSLSAPDAGAEPLDQDLWLRNLSYAEDEIVGVYRIPTEDVTRRTISTDEIKRIPGTFGDPVRVVQNLPGAARAPLGTGLLVIRGANPEDSGIYIDGIRVPLIYHLGGYVSVINADLIDSIDYLPGMYGVEYGRSMGGVIDVKTKREYPEQTRVTWNTDVLDSGFLVEGTAGKNDGLGFAAAARRSYIDAFIPIFTGGTGFTIKPRWYDYQLKLDGVGMDNGRLSAFVFGFEDVLRVATPESFAQGTDQDTQGDIGTKYGTHRGMLRWERRLADDLTLDFVPSFGLDLIQFNLGSEFDVLQRQWLVELRTELDWEASEAVDVLAGLDFIGGTYDFAVEFPFDPTETFTNYDPLAEREPFTQAGDGWAWGPDLYLESDIRPLQDRDKLLLKPGVRFNMVNIVDQVEVYGLDPRFSGRARLVEGGTLKFGTGLYNQPPQPFESWRPGGDVDLGFERAWANELGWEQQLGNGLDADVALFYKFLDRQIVGNPDIEGIDSQFYVNEGIGRAYGVEMIIRQAPVGRFFGWISYTLSRSVRNDYPERDGADPAGLFGPFPTGQGWYAYDFDQTHILVAVAGYKLPKEWELSGKVQYVTGNPYTPYSGGVYDIDQDYYFGYSAGDYNSSRLPPFFAMDLRVDKMFVFKNWQLEVFLDLLNVVRGQNPEFTQDNYDYTESAYIRGLPFIPSPGFEAEFRF